MGSERKAGFPAGENISTGGGVTRQMICRSGFGRMPGGGRI